MKETSAHSWLLKVAPRNMSEVRQLSCIMALTLNLYLCNYKSTERHKGMQLLDSKKYCIPARLLGLQLLNTMYIRCVEKHKPTE